MHRSISPSTVHLTSTMGTRARTFFIKSFSLDSSLTVGLYIRCLSWIRLWMQTDLIWISTGCVSVLVRFYSLSWRSCRVHCANSLVDRSFMRWKFQTDMNRSHSKIPPAPSNFIPPVCGTQTRRVFRVTVVAPDSGYPLTFRLISLPHLEFFLAQRQQQTRTWFMHSKWVHLN